MSAAALLTTPEAGDIVGRNAAESIQRIVERANLERLMAFVETGQFRWQSSPAG
jgi:hypothetical protein